MASDQSDVLRFPWGAAKPVIGVIHVPPLPGSPRFAGDAGAARQSVMRDAAALVDGGVNALLIENFGDAPFYPAGVPPHTVAQLTSLATMLRLQYDVPLGVNVLRNDGRAALAVAAAVGARFIRVNVLCGARLTDQGVIAGAAHEILRDRAYLQAADVQVFADVNVKHSAPLSPRPLAEEVAETIGRGGGEGIIVSGPVTGQPPAAEELAAVREAVGEVPVLIGSGVHHDNIAAFHPLADGFIIGTAFKSQGDVSAPVELQRVKEFMERMPRFVQPRSGDRM